jgi:fructose-1,6-bisphosphatase/inositol monophosphatase family enzyme
MSTGTTTSTPCAEVLRHAARSVLHYLETSVEQQQLAVAPGQVHAGDDPIVADERTHAEFESAARRHPAWDELHIWGVVGEERVVDVPSSPEPGTRVFVVDPLDGSTMWATARLGYCVAAMSLLTNESGELVFECGIVATPVHTFTLIGDELSFGATFDAKVPDSILTSATPEIYPIRPPSLAINGYKARDREAVLAVMAGLRTWDVVTLGGNLLNPYVIIGNLTATVNTRPQYTWDALGVLMCTATDAVVGTVDGTIVSGPRFREQFNRIVLTGNGKLIPPMIVAKNRERFDEVAAVLEPVVDLWSPETAD